MLSNRRPLPRYSGPHHSKSKQKLYSAALFPPPSPLPLVYLHLLLVADGGAYQSTRQEEVVEQSHREAEPERSIRKRKREQDEDVYYLDATKEGNVARFLNVGLLVPNVSTGPYCCKCLYWSPMSLLSVLVSIVYWSLLLSPLSLLQ